MGIESELGKTHCYNQRWFLLQDSACSLEYSQRYGSLFLQPEPITNDTGLVPRINPQSRFIKPSGYQLQATGVIFHRSSPGNTHIVGTSYHQFLHAGVNCWCEHVGPRESELSSVSYTKSWSVAHPTIQAKIVKDIPDLHAIQGGTDG